jgi:hypothetical protein
MTAWILVMIGLASGAPDQLEVRLTGPYRNESDCAKKIKDYELDKPYLDTGMKMGCMPLSEVPSYIVRVYTPPPIPGGAR